MWCIAAALHTAALVMYLLLLLLWWWWLELVWCNSHRSSYFRPERQASNSLLTAHARLRHAAPTAPHPPPCRKQHLATPGRATVASQTPTAAWMDLTWGGGGAQRVRHRHFGAHVFETSELPRERRARRLRSLSILVALPLQDAGRL